ncbi:MAG TPA: hypothetical protein VF697_31870, partial [Archangium sp.]
GCGNGQLEADEECDDGNNKNDDNCVQCKMNFCGDGFIDRQSPHVEECDATGESAGCNIDCTLARCGDGIVNLTRGEVCDDGNGESCGTCGAGCTARKEPKPATGSIIALPGKDIKDGDELTISDGKLSLTFEFNTGAITKPGNVAIDINSSDDPDEVADAIRQAIQWESSRFAIRVPSVSWNVVELKNDKSGISGNVLITESVSKEGFKVNGMSGGSGYDCKLGVGCRSDADCSSGRCRQGVCK